MAVAYGWLYAAAFLALASSGAECPNIFLCSFLRCVLAKGPVLVAAIALENAPLFFSMNAVATPPHLGKEYQRLREAGANRKALAVSLHSEQSEMDSLCTCCNLEEYRTKHEA